MTIFLNQGKFYKQDSQIYTNNKGSNQYSYSTKFLDYREYQETLLNDINLCPDCVTASGLSYAETCNIEEPEPPLLAPVNGIPIFVETTTTTTTTSTTTTVEATTITTTTTTSSSPTTTPAP